MAHVAFHAQQAVEKCLKALLVRRAIAFPPTHNIRVLAQLAEANGGLPAAVEMREIIALTPYAVEHRYPGEYMPIDRNEARSAVVLARVVQNAVRAMLFPVG